jgi:hypothetical protein
VLEISGETAVGEAPGEDGATAQAPTISTSSISTPIPISEPIGRYCRKPSFSSAKSTSSIITTKRKSTATAPT